MEYNAELLVRKEGRKDHLSVQDVTVSPLNDMLFKWKQDGRHADGESGSSSSQGNRRRVREGYASEREREREKQSRGEQGSTQTRTLSR